MHGVARSALERKRHWSQIVSVSRQSRHLGFCARHYDVMDTSRCELRAKAARETNHLSSLDLLVRPNVARLSNVQLVIVAMLLVLLLLYFSGVSSVLYPLATAVILNIVAASVSFPAVSRSGTGMAPSLTPSEVVYFRASIHEIQLDAVRNATTRRARRRRPVPNEPMSSESPDARCSRVISSTTLRRALRGHHSRGPSLQSELSNDPGLTAGDLILTTLEPRA